MIIIVLWVISPIILIPLLIGTENKKNKLGNFVRSLFENGRIDREEYLYLRVKNGAAFRQSGGMYENNTAQNMQNNRNMYAGQPQRIIPQYGQNMNGVQQGRYGQYTAGGVYGNAYYNQPQYRQYSQKACYDQANAYSAVPQKKSGLNPAVSLLIIGVIFVILAGMVFSTAAWLYMSDIERTGVIALAGAFFFGVSALAHRRLKLDNTGIAFYLLGGVFAAITFVTAGYFRLMGEWFSLGGDGTAALLASASAIIGAFSCAAVKLYGKSIFTHIALYSGYAAISLLFIQASDSYSVFALLMSLLSAALIAAVYFFKPKFGELIDAPLNTFVKAAAVIGAIIALPTAAVPWEWNAAGYALISLYIVETALYGLLKDDKRLIGILSALTAVLAVGISEDLTKGSIDEYIMLAALLFVLAMMFRFTKKLRTAFSDFLFPCAMTIVGFRMAYVDLSSALGYSAIIFTAVSAIVMLFALEDGKPHLTAMRIAAPAPIMTAAFFYAAHFDGEFFGASAICLTVMTFAAAVFSLISESGERFRIMHYSFSAASGIMLFASLIAADTISAAVISTVMCAALFAVYMTGHCNILTAAPAIGLYYAAIKIADILTESYDNTANANFIAVSAVFGMLCAVSRLLFDRKILDTNGGKFRIDTAALCSALAPISILCDIGQDNQLWRFIALIELSLFSLNLYREENCGSTNRTVMTAAAAFACLAIYKQPFFVIENEMLLHKVELIPILLFGLAVKMIWKSNKRIAKDLSFAVNLFAMLTLIWDALYFDTLFNTLIVLCTALVILLRSFATKNKRWFAVSAATLVGLTLYIMKDFLAEIDWWVYLLLVGILLITIAAMNEYFKSRGESVKSKAGKFFEEWKNWE